MQGWLKSFERSLETASQSAHPNFRFFISSEPPPLPDMNIITESLLQNCIKVSNEAPQCARPAMPINCPFDYLFYSIFGHPKADERKI
jgi:hypothetical protein